MPKPTAPFHAGSLSPSLMLEVDKFKLDWGTISDLGDCTSERFSLLGELVISGAWFLNPMFSVHAHTPSAAFFRAALKARGQWLRSARQVMSNHGQRDLAREAEHQGRRAAYLALPNPRTEESDSDYHSGTFRLSDLSREQRHEVLSNGKLARQFAFSGIMIIDGNLVPPRTWQSQADQVLHPDRPRIKMVRRRIDLATLKATDDVEPLKLMVREAVQAHLDHHSNDVIFVTPQATISAPSATEDFYVKAEKHQAAWCTLLKRTLGSGNVRRLRRTTDHETLTLVFRGTLVIDGQSSSLDSGRTNPRNPAD